MRFRVLWVRTYRRYWFLRSRAGFAISGEPIGLPCRTVTASFYRCGSSSRALGSPSETIQLSPAFGVATSSAYLRVSSLVARSAFGVHYRRTFHGPSTFRPQGFSPSRRFPPPRALLAFHPAPTSRVFASGVSSHQTGEDDSSSPSSLRAVGDGLLPSCDGAGFRHVDLEVLSNPMIRKRLPGD